MYGRKDIPANPKPNRQAYKPPKPKKYRYVMTVVESVVSTTAIESERKMTYDELKDETETLRVKGRLSFKEITNVDMWCDAAFKDGKEDFDGIAH